MSDKIFLDTNIIVYRFDKSAGQKNITAKKLLDAFYLDFNIKISTQVIEEFSNIAFKKMQPSLSGETIKEFISTIPENQIVIIDKNTISKALFIKEQYKLSFWDSLIISSALLSGCVILYTEDMQNGLIIDNLTIKNPFI